MTKRTWFPRLRENVNCNSLMGAIVEMRMCYGYTREYLTQMREPSGEAARR